MPEWQPGFDPEAWQQSWQNPMVVDNPPGYTGEAGTARDETWLEYLVNYPAPTDTNGDGVINFNDNNPVGYLPNPYAVNDRRLRTLGHAATELGTSYAWAGGDGQGPHLGDYAYDSDGNLKPYDGASTYEDPQRVGYDCSGLVEYATTQAGITGPFVEDDEGNWGPQTVGTYTGSQLGSPLLTPVAPGGTPLPGDLVYYGDGEAYHVGIFVSDGVIINAPGSGLPVQLDARTTSVGGSGWEQVRVLQPAAGSALAPAPATG